MIFSNQTLNREISILLIDDFDISSSNDMIQLKKILKKIFPRDSTLFFSFRREESLTSDEELKKLRAKIFDTFNKEGEYVVLKRLDDARFDSVAKIVINDQTYNFLFDIWNYFYSCTFFIPNKNLTFSDYITFHTNNKFQDIANEKLLNQNFSNFTCIKGLGGDNMVLSYRSNYNLPDLIL
ncbi:hypothetical protein [Chryseobacterium sp.]|uniref:hypothetical protein n=1 Tax=Chryseobacterium sp. TaxID=1871047 RepID=UPI0024E23B8B|nr:hypothetical protein [Chryseobacterium sp.]